MSALLDFFRNLFASDFMPHGHCFFWRPEILWLHVVSDGLITAAYYSIPVTMWWFLRKRPGLKLGWLILMFAGFILACGTTHLIAIWDLWNSAYRLEGLVKAVTAALSISTALVCLKLAPAAAKLPTPDELAQVNLVLQQEVEARREAERKLRELLESERLASEERLRAFFEAAPQGILAMSRDGRIRLMNRRAEEMFGLSRAELLGQSLDILMPERFRDAHRQGREAFFDHPHQRTISPSEGLMGLRADGTEFPVKMNLSFATQGGETVALALVDDATERMRAEAALRDSEGKLRSFLEVASQAIVAVRPNGQMDLVNRRTEEMFGYSREELIGQPLEILLPERYRQGHIGSRANYFAEPRVRPMGAGLDLAGRRKDGTEFPIEIGLSHVQTPEGPLALGLVSDITERKRAEREIAKVNADLRRSNADLEQFSYAASHDLQEPLRMVTAYLQLIEKRASLDEACREYLHFAIDGAQRMKGLIQDLLRFSRAGSQKLDLHMVEASELVESAKRSLQTALDESGATLTVGALPRIAADGGLLTQVFQNLIGNAIKFREPGNQPEVHVAARLSATHWIFSVRDNGIGIPPQHREKVFQIFERLHAVDEYSGSGVGLAIAQRIVERHGGRIWVDEAAGKGATVSFSIPAHAAAAPATLQ